MLTAKFAADRIQEARFRYRSEGQLQIGIRSLLLHHHVPEQEIKREVRLSGRDRIDFLIGALGIEVKVDGTPASVWRQLARYATHEQVGELLLVTTRVRHVAGGPVELGGKPVHYAVVRGGL